LKPTRLHMDLGLLLFDQKYWIFFKIVSRNISVNILFPVPYTGRPKFSVLERNIWNIFIFVNGATTWKTITAL
jgi:hypothetical protein